MKTLMVWKRSRLPALGAAIALIAATLAGLTVNGADAGTASASGKTITHSHATAVWKDMYGNVLCTQRYSAGTRNQRIDLSQSRCAQQLSTTSRSHSGGSPSDSGSINVRITQTGQSTIGKDLWSISISTNWFWSNKGTRALGVPGFGTTKAAHHDWRKAHRSWDKKSVGVDWQGWQPGGNVGYYSWATGWPHSGFHHREVGKFTVPNALSGVNSEYPTNWINSHTNGTWDWDTSCKC